MSISFEQPVRRAVTGSRMRPVRFGTARVALASFGAGDIARPPRFVADELHLLSVRSGTVDLVDLGSTAPVPPGRLRNGESALLVGERLPVHGAALVREPTDLLLLAVPVDAANGVDLGEVHGRLVPRTSELIRPVNAFVDRALRQPRAWQEASGVTGYYFERLLHEMVSGVLVETVLASGAPRPIGRYEAAMSVIMVRHADPGLTPAIVASAANLSLRQLERLFRERGTTPRRAIRRARVELARTLLSDPAYDILDVGDIARHVGFGGGSSLARAMAAESLPPPSRLRRRGSSRLRPDA
ncbi:AraC-like DNA-binding protein [Microbacterium resistens]|uniref:AraC-like DNA-binding protein n=1 Tax=Microbacterium resistens TaxID=156977 RepID=A0ABU1SAB6_9MICO|nr:helix-turn-helix domain-containing protein [Microbacterium resistens]MDR6866524.1 AraC-like DNA-binding protein [Microbacterium resistens]